MYLKDKKVRLKIIKNELTKTDKFAPLYKELHKEARILDGFIQDHISHTKSRQR